MFNFELLDFVKLSGKYCYIQRDNKRQKILNGHVKLFNAEFILPNVKISNYVYKIKFVFL
jgi:hypothetical protein